MDLLLLVLLTNMVGTRSHPNTNTDAADESGASLPSPSTGAPIAASAPPPDLSPLAEDDNAQDDAASTTTTLPPPPNPISVDGIIFYDLHNLYSLFDTLSDSTRIMSGLDEVLPPQPTFPAGEENWYAEGDYIFRYKSKKLGEDAAHTVCMREGHRLMGPRSLAMLRKMATAAANGTIWIRLTQTSRTGNTELIFEYGDGFPVPEGFALSDEDMAMFIFEPSTATKSSCKALDLATLTFQGKDCASTHSFFCGSRSTFVADTQQHNIAVQQRDFIIQQYNSLAAYLTYFKQHLNLTLTNLGPPSCPTPSNTQRATPQMLNGPTFNIRLIQAHAGLHDAEAIIHELYLRLDGAKTSSGLIASLSENGSHLCFYHALPPPPPSPNHSFTLNVVAVTAAVVAALTGLAVLLERCLCRPWQAVPTTDNHELQQRSNIRSILRQPDTPSIRRTRSLTFANPSSPPYNPYFAPSRDIRFHENTRYATPSSSRSSSTLTD